MPKLPVSFAWLRLSTLLALFAVVEAGHAYFAGDAATLPVRVVPHLAAVPVPLDSVAVGPAWLPLPANGYAVSVTHELAGPYTQPTAAALWLLVLAAALAGWLAVVSCLERPAFLVGTGPVIFLLSSLNADSLELFASERPYFLWLSLAVLGAATFGLHLWGEAVRLPARVALLGALVAGLVGFICWKTALPLPDTALQLAAYATPAGAVLVGLLVLWVGVENVRALLWFNTQADQPSGRFGLGPFVAASLLYLGALGLYWWNDNQLAIGFGLHLDPLVLLLPAVLTAALGLGRRAPGFADQVPLPAARVLLGVLTAAAAAALGYALYSANTPLLAAAHTFSSRALLLLGGAFLLYVLINFAPLIRQRLPVYRVVFEPRQLPLYAAYVLGAGGLLVWEVRENFTLYDQVRAGEYNLLGDVARRESERTPDDLATAALAERYYAESGDVLARFNRSAQLGRAALYQFRNQLRNQQNALSRALRRQPDEKVTAHLAAQLTDPADFLAALGVLRQGRREFPGSFLLTSDLAQLFTHSALTDSVAHYLDAAERLRPGSPEGRANQLAFLVSQQAYAPAQKLAADSKAGPADAPLLANKALLDLLTGPPAGPGGAEAAPGSPAPVADPAGLDLDGATFAQLNQRLLQVARQADAAACSRQAAALARLTARPANEPYYEQLLFLQSLLLHAGGQEVAARQALAPLVAGTSATAAYYQYVLGIWQLQQQQYAAAAAQLAGASLLGLDEARTARAWALALAGQPDSARAVAGRLVLGVSPVGRRAGQRVLAALAAGPVLPARPGRALAGSALLRQAQAAEAAGQHAPAGRLYRRAVAEAPFSAAAVLAASRYFTSQGATGTAYEALRQGLNENPDDPALLQEFALAAVSTGLADDAQAALAQVRPRLSPAAYANLLARYAARQAAYRAAAAEFEGLPAGTPGRR